jgi:hypothetical protein
MQGKSTLFSSTAHGATATRCRMSGAHSTSAACPHADLRYQESPIEEGARLIAPLSPRDFADDLVALVDSLDSPRLIVGHSMGGLLANSWPPGPATAAGPSRCIRRRGSCTGGISPMRPTSVWRASSTTIGLRIGAGLLRNALVVPGPRQGVRRRLRRGRHTRARDRRPPRPDGQSTRGASDREGLLERDLSRDHCVRPFGLPRKILPVTMSHIDEWLAQNRLRVLGTPQQAERPVRPETAPQREVNPDQGVRLE